MEGRSATTWLTTAFSKSSKPHEAALVFSIAFYDFARPHMTLGVTPDVAAKLTDHRWTMEVRLTAIAAETGVKPRESFLAPLLQERKSADRTCVLMAD